MTQIESTLTKPPNCPNNPDHLYVLDSGYLLCGD
jgi:hypothetical protein